MNGDILTGAMDESLQQLISSGIVVDTGGYVLAAASGVVGFDHIRVTFNDKIVAAKIQGIDYQSGLALLKAETPLGAPVSLSHQHGCAGQMVIALGNSLGVRASPAMGFCAGFRPDGMMQFSVAIGPGTIGGGVFDMGGRLVGAITGGIGEGRTAEAALAIPAHRLPTIIKYLRTRGDRQAGYIGISTADIEVSPGLVVDLPSSLASATPQREVLSRATMITDVVNLSNAARAGLRPGDLLYSVNEVVFASAWELMQIVQRQRPGAVLKLGVLRNNHPFAIQVQVGPRTITPGGGFVQSNDSSNQEDLVDDSLLKEVELLKRAIQDLERRLDKRSR